MSHCDAVINGDCVEFRCIAALSLDFSLHNLTDFMQMSVARDKLRERIHHGNYRFAHHFLFHSGCNPKGSCTCHPAAVHCDGTS